MALDPNIPGISDDIQKVSAEMTSAAKAAGDLQTILNGLGIAPKFRTELGKIEAELRSLGTATKSAFSADEIKNYTQSLEKTKRLYGELQKAKALGDSSSELILNKKINEELLKTTKHTSVLAKKQDELSKSYAKNVVLLKKVNDMIIGAMPRPAGVTDAELNRQKNLLTRITAEQKDAVDAADLFVKSSKQAVIEVGKLAGKSAEVSEILSKGIDPSKLLESFETVNGGIKHLIDSAEEFKKSMKASPAGGSTFAGSLETEVDALIEKLKRLEVVSEDAKGAQQRLSDATKEFVKQNESGSVSQAAIQNLENSKKELAAITSILSKAQKDVADTKNKIKSKKEERIVRSGGMSSLSNEEKEQAAEIDSIVRSAEKSVEVMDQQVNSNIKLQTEVANTEQEYSKFNKVLKTCDNALNTSGKSLDQYIKGLNLGSNKTLIMGAALFYVANKAAEFGKSVEQMAVGFAKFNMQQAIASKTTLKAFGGVDKLEKLRDNLEMTTEQWSNFQKVLEEGAMSGVVSIDQVANAALKLKETFGGDQTEMVKEYVDLLKSMPNIESQLKVTADIDDQVAGWYAIAKAGKTKQVIQMQMAGLAGGEQDLSGIPEGDRKIIDVSQKTNKAIEDVKKGIYELIGPRMAEMLGALKYANSFMPLLQAISTGIAIMNATNMLGGAGKLSLLAGGAKAGSSLALGKSIGTSAGIAMGRTTAKFAKTIPYLGAAIAVGSSAYEGYEEYKETGSVGRAGAKAGGGLAGGAAGMWGGAAMGAAIGTAILPGIGTAIGGLIGGGIGAWGGSEIGSMAGKSIYDSVYGEPGTKEDNATKQLEDLEIKNYKERQKRIHDSAIEFEKILKGIDSAAGDATLQISKMKEELSKLKIDNFDKFDGSLGAFNNSLYEASANILKQVSMLQSNFDQARKKIFNSDMIGQMKLQSLNEVNKKEIEMRIKAIDDLSGLIGQFDKIPEIIKNNLQKKINNIEIEMRSSFQGGYGNTQGLLFENIKLDTDNLTKSLEQIPVDLENAKKIRNVSVEKGKTAALEYKQRYGQDVENVDIPATIKQLQEAINTTKQQLTPDSTTLDTPEYLQAQDNLKQAERAAQLAYEKAISPNIKGEERNMAWEASYSADEEKVKAQLEMEDQTDARQERFNALPKRGDSWDLNIESKAGVQNKQKEQAQEALANYENQKTLLESTEEARKSNVAFLDAVTKSYDAVKEKTLKLSGSLAEYANSVETDPYLQLLQKELKVQQAKEAYRLQLLGDTKYYLKTQQAEMSVIKREQELIKNALNGFQQFTEQELKKPLETIQNLKANIDNMIYANNLLTDEGQKTYNDKGSQLEDQFKSYQNSTNDQDRQKYAEQMVKTAEEQNKILKDQQVANKNAGKQDDPNLQSAINENAKQLAASMILAFGTEGAKKKLEASKDEKALQYLNAIRRDFAAQLQINLTSPVSKLIASQQDLASEMFNLANASADLGMAREAMLSAQDAATKAYENNTKAIEAAAKASDKAKEDLDSEKKKLEEMKKDKKTPQADIAEQAEKVKNAEAYVLETVNKKLAAEKKAASDLINMRNKAATEFLNIQNKMISIQQQGIDAELDYLRQIGGSYNLIFDLQKQQISMEVAKYQNMQEAFSNMQKGSMEYLQMEMDIKVQGYKIAAQALGAQRNVYEKLTEMAFGALSDKAGKKQMNSESRFFGRGYVKSAATGMIVQGKARTLEDRAGEMAGAANSIAADQLKIQKESQETLEKIYAEVKDKSTPALADGGRVPFKPGGHHVIIGEAGPEWVLNVKQMKQVQEQAIDKYKKSLPKLADGIAGMRVNGGTVYYQDKPAWTGFGPTEPEKKSNNNDSSTKVPVPAAVPSRTTTSFKPETAKAPSTTPPPAPAAPTPGNRSLTVSGNGSTKITIDFTDRAYEMLRASVKQQSATASR